MMSLPKRILLVSHTHWDREWYLAFHTFRVKLVETVRKVLTALEDDPSFAHFMLDGQAVILEDYLEVRPEDAARLQGHVSSGRLGIGPWYILPDEFLVSGESLVRNALIGHQVCAASGGAAPVGYMPDTFGHVAQMPQILRGCGIDNFIFWRGTGDELDDLGLGFHWEGPDGSRVYALQQHGGYCNAAGLGLEEIWHAHTQRTVSPEVAVTQVEKLLDEMQPRNNLDFALLNNGCDHFPPQKDLGGVLAALRARWPEVEFSHTSYADAFAQLRQQADQLGVHRGEFLSGKLAHILSGIWSARMPLKQQNAACQDLLTHVAEPLSAYMYAMQGCDYPSGLLGYAWKLLLKNQPHDSIGGCSIDAVHREMGPRFAGVIETCDEVLRGQFEILAPHFARDAGDDGATRLVVANALPASRTEVVERLVVLDPEHAKGAHVQVFDPDGNPVPTCVLDDRFTYRFWYVNYRGLLRSEQQLEQLATFQLQEAERMNKQPGDEGPLDRFVHLQFVASDLPGVGHRNYTIETLDAPPEDVPPVRTPEVKGNRIDNQVVGVVLEANGSFTLYDHRTGMSFSGLNVLEVEGDKGDEYDFEPIPEHAPRVVQGILAEPPPPPPDGLRRSLLALVAVEIPWAGWQQPVTLYLDVQVTLTAGSPLVEVQVTNLRNDARNTRLRARFSTDLQTETLISDGHFMVHERPFERPSGEDWVQPSPPTWPQQDFSAIRDPRGGLALLNQGLPEISATRDASGAALALTLMRNVGWLSRDDLSTRRNQGAGPMLPTPEAQGGGPHTWSYALLPFGPETEASDLKRAATRYRCPPLTLQGVADQGHAEGGLLQCDSKHVVVSAIKKCDSRDTLLVRVFNTVATADAAVLRFGRAVAAAWRTDLLERRDEEISVDTTAHRAVAPGSMGTDASALAPGSTAEVGKDDAPGTSLVLDVAGHQILTVEVAFA